MIKKFHLVFLFLLLSFSSTYLQAQEAHSFSHIYLAEGGFLKAQVLTQDSAGWCTLRLRTGEILHLEVNSIKRIKSVKQKEIIHPKGHTVTTEGSYFNFQFGFLGGVRSGRFSDPIVSMELFSFSAGKYLNPNLQVGGGTALDFYHQPFIPLFAEAKYFLRAKEKVSIYGGLQTGYSLSFNPFNQDQTGGGAMVHPAVGLRFSGKNKSSFLLELGNRYQWATLESEWRNTTDKIIFRRASLRVGWSF